MLSTNNKTLFTSPDSEGFQELGQEPKYYDRRCCYCYYLSGNSKGLGSWEPGTIDYISNKAFLVAQMVKNPPVMQETWVQSLSWVDPLEKGIHPIPVILPGESHGQRSQAGYDL